MQRKISHPDVTHDSCKRGVVAMRSHKLTCKHVALLLAAVSSEYRPASHERQAVATACEENFPAEQGVHVELVDAPALSE